ncbi:MAG: ribosome recycling factor [Patescibacteria group bacterium]|nr:ribosome recycling factor [Patescibacteria group bacterium]
MTDQLLKTLESELTGVTQKLRQDFTAIRGNRPSVETIQDIKVNLYDQWLTVKELGSLSILPPRTIQVMVWDKSAVGAVTKAIEDAHLGLSASNEGNTIRATLSPLGNERREEITKTIKKTAEAARIQVRGRRDEAMKRLKDAEGKKEITEDDAFKAKEKIQKSVDRANADIERSVAAKLEELGE